MQLKNSIFALLFLSISLPSTAVNPGIAKQLIPSQQQTDQLPEHMQLPLQPNDPYERRCRCLGAVAIGTFGFIYLSTLILAVQVHNLK